jgi:membrane protease YdiL (CAAX protease family)
MPVDEGTVSGPDWWLKLNVAWWALTIGPDYPPDERDRRDRYLFGLELPSRATVAIFATTALILVDQLGWLRAAIPDLHFERFVLFLVAPLAIVVFGFRDDPRRYGLRVGRWRWGLGLLVVGLAVMTPIIWWLSTLPAFQAFYGSQELTPLDPDTGPGGLLGGHVLELVAAEFLLRGFLMFALWRRIGALALIVVQVPFILTHLGKPELELWSTFIGGAVFAWLDWRTGSILWSGLAHAYIATLIVVLARGAALGT